MRRKVGIDVFVPPLSVCGFIFPSSSLTNDRAIKECCFLPGDSVKLSHE